MFFLDFLKFEHFLDILVFFSCFPGFLWFLESLKKLFFIKNFKRQILFRVPNNNKPLTTLNQIFRTGKLPFPLPFFKFYL